MDDDMKELHHDDYPSQSEMEEWLFHLLAHLFFVVIIGNSLISKE